MLIIGIHSIFTIIITILLIKTFDKLDENVNIEMSRRDMIGITIVSLFSSFCINRVGQDNIFIYIIFTIINIFIIMMAYTDLKLMEVYGIINFVVLVLVIIYFVPNIDKFRLLISNDMQFKMFLACICILFVLMLTQGVGLGDTMLYFSLGILYTVTSKHGCLLLILNILISNTLFLITNSFKFIKNKKQKLPLIPYILLTWLILMRLM